MSYIIDTGDHTSGTPNLIGGFDIVGLRGQENNLRGSQGSDFIQGGNHNDIISGQAGFDFINAGAGDDFVSGGKDIDFILGGAGNDTLNGDEGNDFIVGGEGDDLINGGKGNDFLIGGKGRDTFVLEFFGTESSSDTIADFNVQEDKLRIQGVGLDADVQYDEITGKVSVNGQEIAQLNPGLNFNDDNYEIF
jgi:Ca2+-binding RTX toxin-like protein